jgi:hypothetical protein
MDGASVRAQLDEIRYALQQNGEEREALLSLLKGYESWLRLHPEAEKQMSLPLAQVPTPARKETPIVGTTSLRGAVLRILKEAHGEPLQTREILRRALELGARSGSTNPQGAVDLLCYSLVKSHPVVKVGPRTWRWAGADTSGEAPE